MSRQFANVSYSPWRNPYSSPAEAEKPFYAAPSAPQQPVYRRIVLPPAPIFYHPDVEQVIDDSDEESDAGPSGVPIDNPIEEVPKPTEPPPVHEELILAAPSSTPPVPEPPSQNIVDVPSPAPTENAVPEASTENAHENALSEQAEPASSTTEDGDGANAVADVKDEPPGGGGNDIGQEGDNAPPPSEPPQEDKQAELILEPIEPAVETKEESDNANVAVEQSPPDPPCDATEEAAEETVPEPPAEHEKSGECEQVAMETPKSPTAKSVHFGSDVKDPDAASIGSNKKKDKKKARIITKGKPNAFMRIRDPPPPTPPSPPPKEEKTSKEDKKSVRESKKKERSSSVSKEAADRPPPPPSPVLSKRKPSKTEDRKKKKQDEKDKKSKGKKSKKGSNLSHADDKPASDVADAQSKAPEGSPPEPPIDASPEQQDPSPEIVEDDKDVEDAESPTDGQDSNKEVAVEETPTEEIATEEDTNEVAVEETPAEEIAVEEDTNEVVEDSPATNEEAMSPPDPASTSAPDVENDHPGQLEDAAPQNDEEVVVQSEPVVQDEPVVETTDPKPPTENLADKVNQQEEQHGQIKKSVPEGDLPEESLPAEQEAEETSDNHEEINQPDPTEESVPEGDMVEETSDIPKLADIVPEEESSEESSPAQEASDIPEIADTVPEEAASEESSPPQDTGPVNVTEEVDPSVQETVAAPSDDARDDARDDAPESSGDVSPTEGAEVCAEEDSEKTSHEEKTIAQPGSEEAIVEDKENEGTTSDDPVAIDPDDHEEGVTHSEKSVNEPVIELPADDEAKSSDDGPDQPSTTESKPNSASIEKTAEDGSQDCGEGESDETVTIKEGNVEGVVANAISDQISVTPSPEADVCANIAPPVQEQEVAEEAASVEEDVGAVNEQTMDGPASPTGVDRNDETLLEGEDGSKGDHSSDYTSEDTTPQKSLDADDNSVPTEGTQQPLPDEQTHDADATSQDEWEIEDLESDQVEPGERTVEVQELQAELEDSPLESSHDATQEPISINEQPENLEKIEEFEGEMAAASDEPTEISLVDNFDAKDSSDQQPIVIEDAAPTQPSEEDTNEPVVDEVADTQVEKKASEEDSAVDECITVSEYAVEAQTPAMSEEAIDAPPEIDAHAPEEDLTTNITTSIGAGIVGVQSTNPVENVETRCVHEEPPPSFDDTQNKIPPTTDEKSNESSHDHMPETVAPPDVPEATPPSAAAELDELGSKTGSHSEEQSILEPVHESPIDSTNVESSLEASEENQDNSNPEPEDTEPAEPQEAQDIPETNAVDSIEEAAEAMEPEMTLVDDSPVQQLSVSSEEAADEPNAAAETSSMENNLDASSDVVEDEAFEPELEPESTSDEPSPTQSNEVVDNEVRDAPDSLEPTDVTNEVPEENLSSDEHAAVDAALPPDEPSQDEAIDHNEPPEILKASEDPSNPDLTEPEVTADAAADNGECQSMSSEQDGIGEGQSEAPQVEVQMESNDSSVQEEIPKSDASPVVEAPESKLEQLQGLEKADAQLPVKTEEAVVEPIDQPYEAEKGSRLVEEGEASNQALEEPTQDVGIEEPPPQATEEAAREVPESTDQADNDVAVDESKETEATRSNEAQGDTEQLQGESQPIEAFEEVQPTTPDPEPAKGPAPEVERISVLDEQAPQAQSEDGVVKVDTTADEHVQQEFTPLEEIEVVDVEQEQAVPVDLQESSTSLPNEAETNLEAKESTNVVEYNEFEIEPALTYSVEEIEDKSIKQPELIGEDMPQADPPVAEETVQEDLPAPTEQAGIVPLETSLEPTEDSPKAQLPVTPPNESSVMDEPAVAPSPREKHHRRHSHSYRDARHRSYRDGERDDRHGSHRESHRRRESNASTKERPAFNAMALLAVSKLAGSAKNKRRDSMTDKEPGKNKERVRELEQEHSSSSKERSHREHRSHRHREHGDEKDGKRKALEDLEAAAARRRRHEARRTEKENLASEEAARLAGEDEARRERRRQERRTRRAEEAQVAKEAGEKRVAKEEEEKHLRHERRRQRHEAEKETRRLEREKVEQMEETRRLRRQRRVDLAEEKLSAVKPKDLVPEELEGSDAARRAAEEDPDVAPATPVTPRAPTRRHTGERRRAPPPPPVRKNSLLGGFSLFGRSKTEPVVPAAKAIKPVARVRTDPTEAVPVSPIEILRKDKDHHTSSHNSSNGSRDRGERPHRSRRHSHSQHHHRRFNSAEEESEYRAKKEARRRARDHEHEMSGGRDGGISLRTPVNEVPPHAPKPAEPEPYLEPEHQERTRSPLVEDSPAAVGVSSTSSTERRELRRSTRRVSVIEPERPEPPKSRRISVIERERPTGRRTESDRPHMRGAGDERVRPRRNNTGRSGSERSKKKDDGGFKGFFGGLKKIVA